MPRTIAVLPFVDLEGSSGSGAETWLTRSFAEDLATELGRFALLEVVHTYSSFQAERDAGDRALGQALGAPYLLRGSVRRAGERLLVSVRLTEAASAKQLWAERFEAPAQETPAVQIDIAARVASALAVELDRRALSGARARPVAHLEAYDCWLRGHDELRQGTRDSDEGARQLFQRALELDPHFARAHAGLSLSHFNEWSCQAWEQWDETERKAYEAARRALDLDDSDPVIHLILGRIQLYRGRFEAAERHFELAHALNPNDADGLMQIAIGRAFLGPSEDALDLIAKAKRLNPRHENWYFAYEQYVCFALGRYAEGVRAGELCGPITVDHGALMAAGLVRLGRREEARASMDDFLTSFREKILFGREPEPGEPLRWLQHVNPFRHERAREHFAAALLEAGLARDPDAGARLDVEPAPAAARALFRVEDGLLHASWQGRGVRLQPVKGFADLGELLARPRERVHCLELAGRPAPLDRRDSVLDREGRRALEARVRDLQEELDQAEARHDLGTAERARAELEAVVEGLAGALGIGGRARALGCGVEKARTAVTWRIRSALRKLADAHPALGRHLENSVRTGTYCVYEPEADVRWEL